jgi:hypothetical protein
LSHVVSAEGLRPECSPARLCCRVNSSRSRDRGSGATIGRRDRSVSPPRCGPLRSGRITATLRHTETAITVPQGGQGAGQRIGCRP